MATNWCIQKGVICDRVAASGYCAQTACTRIFQNSTLRKTNADRVRSMTDEELAVYLSENSWDCNDCKSGQENMDNPFAIRCDKKCAEHCLEWLQQSAKEG